MSIEGSRSAEARIAAACAGDLAAMSALLDELSDFVGRICGAIALDDGPDAAQEVLVQVFRDLPTLREPAHLRAWVRRIAVRESVRIARRAGREPPVEDPELGSEVPDLEAIHDVRAVLEQLPPETRAILVLRDLEGMSEREAADHLNVAVGTAKSRLSRARALFVERWRSR